MARTRPILFRKDGEDPASSPEGNTGEAAQTEDSEKEQSTEFSADCYLLDYTEEITTRAVPITTAFSGVYFSSKNDNGVSGGTTKSFGTFLSSMTGRKSLQELSELTSLQLSGIYPIVRIFRIDSDGSTTKKRQFIFNKDLNNLFDLYQDDPQIGSVTGCGIKNFSYTLAGTNPVEAERSVDVSMTLFFSSPLEFLGLNKEENLSNIELLRNKGNLYDNSDKEDVNGTNTNVVGKTTQYITLIERPRPKDEKNTYIAKDFRLVAEISYGVIQDDIIPSELREKLLNLKLILDLSLINHELNFTEEGTLELKVNYYGSLQQYMNSPEADYFKNKFDANQQYKDASTSLATAKETLELAKKAIQCGKNDETIKKLDEAQSKVLELQAKSEEAFADAKGTVYSGFIEDLYKNNKLYTFTIDSDEVTKWVNYINTGGIKPDFPVSKIGTDSDSVDDAIEGAEEASSETKEDIQSTIDTKREKKVKIDEELAITFFYFGDLLQSIAKVYELSTKTSIRIILGDIEYQTNIGASRKYNIGEVPIDIDFFQAWFLEKIIKPGKISYRFDALLRDLVNGLLRPALDTNCILQTVQNKNVKIDLNFTNFTLETSSDPLRSASNDQGVINNNPSIAKGSKIYNYFCIYGTESLCSRKDANPTKDNNDGIMHIYVGKNNGLATSIKFKRVDQPYLKEAKATRQGFTPLSSLRDIYNCDVTMFGNNIFYPGMSIFIHPPYQFGDPTKNNKTLSNIMGIGGYYSIIKVTTDITDGKAETKLDCYFQSSGDGCGNLKGKCPA